MSVLRLSRTTLTAASQVPSSLQSPARFDATFRTVPFSSVLSELASRAQAPLTPRQRYVTAVLREVLTDDFEYTSTLRGRPGERDPPAYDPPIRPPSEPSPSNGAHHLSTDLCKISAETLWAYRTGRRHGVPFYAASLGSVSRALHHARAHLRSAASRPLFGKYPLRLRDATKFPLYPVTRDAVASGLRWDLQAQGVVEVSVEGISDILRPTAAPEHFRRHAHITGGYYAPLADLREELVDIKRRAADAVQHNADARVFCEKSLLQFASASDAQDAELLQQRPSTQREATTLPRRLAKGVWRRFESFEPLPPLPPPSPPAARMHLTQQQRLSDTVTVDYRFGSQSVDAAFRAHPDLCAQRQRPTLSELRSEAKAHEATYDAVGPVAIDKLIATRNVLERAEARESIGVIDRAAALLSDLDEVVDLAPNVDIDEYARRYPATAVSVLVMLIDTFLGGASRQRLSVAAVGRHVKTPYLPVSARPLAIGVDASGVIRPLVAWIDARPPTSEVSSGLATGTSTALTVVMAPTYSMGAKPDEAGEDEKYIHNRPRPMVMRVEGRAISDVSALFKFSPQSIMTATAHLTHAVLSCWLMKRGILRMLVPPSSAYFRVDGMFYERLGYDQAIHNLSSSLGSTFHPGTLAAARGRVFRRLEGEDGKVELRGGLMDPYALYRDNTSCYTDAVGPGTGGGTSGIGAGRLTTSLHVRSKDAKIKAQLDEATVEALMSVPRPLVIVGGGKEGTVQPSPVPYVPSLRGRPCAAPILHETTAVWVPMYPPVGSGSGGGVGAIQSAKLCAAVEGVYEPGAVSGAVEAFLETRQRAKEGGGQGTSPSASDPGADDVVSARERMYARFIPTAQSASTVSDPSLLRLASLARLSAVTTMTGASASSASRESRDHSNPAFLALARTPFGRPVKPFYEQSASLGHCVAAVGNAWLAAQLSRALVAVLFDDSASGLYLRDGLIKTYKDFITHSLNAWRSLGSQSQSGFADIADADIPGLVKSLFGEVAEVRDECFKALPAWSPTFTRVLDGFEREDHRARFAARWEMLRPPGAAVPVTTFMPRNSLASGGAEVSQAGSDAKPGSLLGGEVGESGGVEGDVDVRGAGEAAGTIPTAQAVVEERELADDELDALFKDLV